MKKLLLILALAVLAAFQNAAAQSGTQEYVDIPGTRVRMKLPAGFNLSLYGIGVILNDSESLIYVMDNISGDYYKNAEDFVRTELNKFTLTPVYFEQMTIEGYDARFAAIESTAFNPGGMALVFGDSTFCTLIMAIYNHSLEIGAIKEAMMSVEYSRDKAIDPAALHLFSVGDNSSGFAFSEYSMGIFSYTKENPADPARPPLKVMVIPQPIPQGLDEFDLMMVAVENVKQHPDVTAARYDVVVPRRTSLNGCHFRECILETPYTAWYFAVFADTDRRRAVTVMHDFPHNESEMIADSELADIKQFVAAIRLPMQLTPPPIRINR